MNILPVALLSIFNVLTRSSLNTIDRYLFRNNNKFIISHALTTLTPLILGFFGLLFLGNLSKFFADFLSFRSFLLSVATHLVSLCFCYCFKHWEVRKVVIQSKLTDFVLPILILIPVATEFNHLQWKHYFTIGIGWIGIIPIILKEKTLSYLLHQSTLFLVVCSAFQILISSVCFTSCQSTFADIYTFTISTLLWRGILVIGPVAWELITQNIAIQLPANSFTKIHLLRAILALLTQLTFVWCMMKNQPFIVWPILNMTPLTSMIISRYLLGEPIRLQELFAVACLFFCSIIALL